MSDRQGIQGTRAVQEISTSQDGKKPPRLPSATAQFDGVPGPHGERIYTREQVSRLLGISRRGNKYLRMLFIHGARAALPSLAASPSPIGAWLRGLLARGHRNVAIVALANKLARIAWAILRGSGSFDLRHGAMAA